MPIANSDEIVINGNLENSAEKIVWLSHLDGTTNRLIDSAHIGKNQSFSFRMKVNDAGFYVLASKRNDYAILIARMGETVFVKGDADNLASTWTATGSDETKRYLEYWKFTRKQLKRVDSLTFVFRNSHMNPEYLTTRIKLDSIFNTIMDKQHDEATRFINKNPGSLASLLVLQAKFSSLPLFNEERDINYFKLLDSCLSKSNKNTKIVYDFHKRVQIILRKSKNHQDNNGILPPGDLNPSYIPSH